MRKWVAAFAVSEVLVVHIQLHRDSHSFSMTDLVLVAGLYLLEPAALITAQVAGVGLVLVLHRRQAPVKVGYNMALFAADTAVALAVFRLFPVTSISSDGWAWAATGCAVVAGGTVAAAASPKPVRMRPGSIAITSTPNPRTSKRSASLRASTACLVAW